MLPLSRFRPAAFAFAAALVAWATLATGGAAHGADAVVRLAPVDEAGGDASWARFRLRLVDALLKRDQKFVLSILERNVRNISNVEGAAEFRKLWEPQSAESPLWTELARLLQLGSAQIKQDKTSEVCAPYVYYRWPEEAPASANAAVIAKEALLKAKPSMSAATLQVLSYDLVNVTDWEVADEEKGARQIWVAVRTPTAAGFLPQEQARSPLEYRACFVKRDGNWRLSGLEAGE